jgi:hypothetical protein
MTKRPVDELDEHVAHPNPLQAFLFYGEVIHHSFGFQARQVKCPIIL